MGVCVLPDTMQPSPAHPLGVVAICLWRTYFQLRTVDHRDGISFFLLPNKINLFTILSSPFQLAPFPGRKKATSNWHQGQVVGSQTMAYPSSFRSQAGKDAFGIGFSSVCSNWLTLDNNPTYISSSQLGHGKSIAEFLLFSFFPLDFEPFFLLKLEQ